MGSKERRERAKAETRQLILDATRELLLAEGPEALTMRRIAQRIEYSAPAIYVHFADKEALLRELCVTDFSVFAAAFMAVPSDTDPLERLMGFGRAYLQFAADHPAPYRLLFMTPRLPLAEPGDDDPGLAVYSMLVSAVRQAQDSGALHAGWTDADGVAQSLWCSLHGVVSLHMCMNKEGGPIVFQSPTQLADTLVAVLMEGFRRPPPGAM